jgi:hypothetical protein
MDVIITIKTMNFSLLYKRLNNELFTVLFRSYISDLTFLEDLFQDGE